jgi:hypothetical protein
MIPSMPPLNERQLPAFRESLSKWASDIMHKRKPSGLAHDLSRAHEAAVSEPLDDRSIYVDLANLRGLSAGTQNLGGFLVAPADHSNRRRTPQDYAVWEIHPVMKIEAIRN